jgi:hypothetical protein
MKIDSHFKGYKTTAVEGDINPNPRVDKFKDDENLFRMYFLH